MYIVSNHGQFVNNQCELLCPLMNSFSIRKRDTTAFIKGSVPEMAASLLEELYHYSISQNQTQIQITNDYLCSKLRRVKTTIKNNVRRLKEIGLIRVEYTRSEYDRLKTIRTIEFCKDKIQELYGWTLEELFCEKKRQERRVQYRGQLLPPDKSSTSSVPDSSPRFTRLASGTSLNLQSQELPSDLRVALKTKKLKSFFNFSFKEKKVPLLNTTDAEKNEYTYEPSYYRAGEIPLSDLFRNIAGRSGVPSFYHDSRYEYFEAHYDGQIVKSVTITWSRWCEREAEGFNGLKRTPPHDVIERIEAYKENPQATTDDQALSLYRRQTSVNEDTFKEECPSIKAIREKIKKVLKTYYNDENDGLYHSWFDVPIKKEDNEFKLCYETTFRYDSVLRRYPRVFDTILGLSPIKI